MIPIFCFTDPKFLAIADEVGIMTGIRQHSISEKNKKYGRFLDNDFKKPDFKDYENLIQKLKPEIAVLPDLFSEKELVISMRLYHKYDFCKFIFVPKYNCIDKIPKDAVVGISVPNQFSTTPISFSWFSRFKPHILGGTPPVQAKLALKYNGVSADTNSFTKVINISNKAFIPNPPYWKQDKSRPMMDTFRESLENIKIFWNNYEEIKKNQRSLW